MIAVVAFCAFPACEYGQRPPWLSQSYSYRPAPRPNYYSQSRRSRSHIARSRSTPRQTDTANHPASPEIETDHATAPANAAPEVTLSLAGDSGDRERAQRLLERTSANLYKARRHVLNDGQRAVYERAGQLAERARRALADNDCAAASSLALKASSLSARLAGE